jgi:hypothetical protein
MLDIDSKAGATFFVKVLRSYGSYEILFIDLIPLKDV